MRFKIIHFWVRIPGVIWPRVLVRADPLAVGLEPVHVLLVPEAGVGTVSFLAHFEVQFLFIILIHIVVVVQILPHGSIVLIQFVHAELLLSTVARDLISGAYFFRLVFSIVIAIENYRVFDLGCTM